MKTGNPLFFYLNFHFALKMDSTFHYSDVHDSFINPT
jgi:hypothetical protein